LVPKPPQLPDCSGVIGSLEQELQPALQACVCLNEHPARLRANDVHVSSDFNSGHDRGVRV